MKKKILVLLLITLMLVALAPQMALAVEQYQILVEDGQTVNLSTGEVTWTESGNLVDTYNLSNHQIVVADGAAVVFTGSGDVTIWCGTGTAVTLDNVTNHASYCALGYTGISGTLTLVGTNDLVSGEAPGIFVGFGTELEIKDDGVGGEDSLTATGGNCSAGIGGGYYERAGDITISGGTVTATGGFGSAGIGGGYRDIGIINDDHGTITISGGTVTATGGQWGAGIGGGINSLDGGDIKISGGTVSATGGKNSAGIGGGNDGSGRGIYGSGGTITVSGGMVSATGGENGAGIGGGNYGGAGTITVSGGTVSATGGENSAGIGGGRYGSGGDISIYGGVIFAQRGSGNDLDIGSGYNSSGGSLVLEGDSMVFLRNNTTVTPVTACYVNFSYKDADGGKLYGITLPDGWTGAGLYVIPCNINYDDNGGTGFNSMTLPKGGIIPVQSSDAFAWPGHTFRQWNTAADGSGDGYDPGDDIVMDSNKTLYAIWEAVDVTGVDITSSIEILSPGGIAALTADVTPSGAADKSLDWTSSDTNVATVDNRGVVTAVGTGSAVITAKSISNPSYFDTCQIAVSSVLLNYALSTGSTMEMTAAVSPTSNTAVWTSDNTGVAEVDADGKVTAIAPGLAMITVTAGGVSQTVGVAVYDQTVTSVKLNRTSVDLTVGGSVGLTAYVDPDDAVNKDVTWTSDDEDVAKVSDSGTVTAVGKGTTKITAKSGGQSASCRVEVTKPVASVSIGDSSKKLSLNETTSLIVTVSPSDATNADVTWTSSDESIATVDDSGNVTAMGFGSTTVIAEAEGKYDTCTVSVVKTGVTGVTLSSTSKTINVGDTATLSATVNPSGATYADVTWKSTNTSVAKVDQSGKATAMSEGAASIIADADGVYAVCTILVSSEPEDESSDENDVTPTATPSATPTVSPSGGTEDVPDTGDDSDTTPQVEKIMITIVVGDLPEGTTSVRLPSGEVVELGGLDTIQVEVDEGDISEDGSVEIVPLDDEGTPLGTYAATTEVIAVPDTADAWSTIWPVLMWVLIGICVLGAAGAALYLVMKKRHRA